MNQITLVQHHPDEGMGLIQSWLQSRQLEVALVKTFTEEDEPSLTSWPDPSGVEKCILLGGPANVGDEHLADEQQWLSQVVATGGSVLGICLGAQLLASAYGAQITSLPQTELGWYELQPEFNASEVFASLFGTAFQWHGRQFALPTGALPLGYTETCRVQGFHLNRQVGVQFHPEWTQRQIQQFALLEQWPEDIYQGGESDRQRQQRLNPFLDAWWRL